MDIAKELRQNHGFYFCTNGFQLVSKNQSLCHNDRISFSSSTCSDEVGNRFMPSVWNPDSCTECQCNYGTLRCSRNIVNQFNPKEVISYSGCVQPQCNVLEFINAYHSCQVFKWGDKYYESNSHWTSEGIPFYSTTFQYKPGCYFQSTSGQTTYDMIKCTGSYPSLRNTPFFSRDRHFLCQSGDQLIPKDLICNNIYDCGDKSDEVLCQTHYCRDLTRGSKVWKRIPVNTKIYFNCSDINQNYTGTYRNMCVYNKNGIGRLRAEWINESCLCENKDMLRYIDNKFHAANVTDQRFMKILTYNADEFKMINKRIVFDYYKRCYERNMLRLIPATSSNVDELARFFKTMLVFIRSSFWDSKEMSSLICSYDKLEKERRALKDEALEIFQNAPHNPYTAMILHIIERQLDWGRNFLHAVNLPVAARHWLRQKIHLDVSLYKVTLKKETIEDPKPLQKNSTENENTTATIKENRTISDHKPLNIICKEALTGFKKSISKNSTYTVLEMTATPLLKNKQKFLEIGLIIAATVTMAISIIFLSCLRIKKSTKFFVHKSLMIALCMGNVAYLADVAFTAKNDYPDACTALAVVQHYFHTAVFTWMLAAATHLYFKLIAVFSTFDKRITYCLIGWGLPVLIVGTAAVLKPSIYNMAPQEYDLDCGDSMSYRIVIVREFCWLEGGFWIYNGPVLGLLLINAVLFLVFLRVAYGKIASRLSNDNLKKAKKLFKSVVALLPVLGVSWLLGFTVNVHWIFLYVSLVVNATQGIFLSVVHCFMDDQVKKAIKKRRRQSNGLVAAANPVDEVKDPSMPAAKVLEVNCSGQENQNIGIKPQDAPPDTQDTKL